MATITPLLLPIILTLLLPNTADALRFDYATLTLATLKLLGDAHLKQWVVADPDSRTLLVDPECEFLLLASDGLWDKVDNQEAVDIARPHCTGSDKASRVDACRRLVETAVSRGSTDDISVLIIQLHKFTASS
jgi:protein phosphatase 1L